MSSTTFDVSKRVARQERLNKADHATPSSLNGKTKPTLFRLDSRLSKPVVSKTPSKQKPSQGSPLFKLQTVKLKPFSSYYNEQQFRRQLELLSHQDAFRLSPAPASSTTGKTSAVMQALQMADEAGSMVATSIGAKVGRKAGAFVAAGLYEIASSAAWEGGGRLHAALTGSQFSSSSAPSLGARMARFLRNGTAGSISAMTERWSAPLSNRVIKLAQGHNVQALSAPVTGLLAWGARSAVEVPLQTASGVAGHLVQNTFEGKKTNLLAATQENLLWSAAFQGVQLPFAALGIRHSGDFQKKLAPYVLKAGHWLDQQTGQLRAINNGLALRQDKLDRILTKQRARYFTQAAKRADGQGKTSLAESYRARAQAAEAYHQAAHAYANANRVVAETTSSRASGSVATLIAAERKTASQWKMEARQHIQKARHSLHEAHEVGDVTSLNQFRDFWGQTRRWGHQLGRNPPIAIRVFSDGWQESLDNFRRGPLREVDQTIQSIKVNQDIAEADRFQNLAARHAKEASNQAQKTMRQAQAVKGEALQKRVIASQYNLRLQEKAQVKVAKTAHALERAAYYDDLASKHQAQARLPVFPWDRTDDVRVITKSHKDEARALRDKAYVLRQTARSFKDEADLALKEAARFGQGDLSVRWPNWLNERSADTYRSIAYDRNARASRARAKARDASIRGDEELAASYQAEVKENLNEAKIKTQQWRQASQWGTERVLRQGIAWGWGKISKGLKNGLEELDHRLAFQPTRASDPLIYMGPAPLPVSPAYLKDFDSAQKRLCVVTCSFSKKAGAFGLELGTWLRHQGERPMIKPMVSFGRNTFLIGKTAFDGVLTVTRPVTSLISNGIDRTVDFGRLSTKVGAHWLAASSIASLAGFHIAGIRFNDPMALELVNMSSNERHTAGYRTATLYAPGVRWDAMLVGGTAKGINMDEIRRGLTGKGFDPSKVIEMGEMIPHFYTQRDAKGHMVGNSRITGRQSAVVIGTNFRVGANWMGVQQSAFAQLGTVELGPHHLKIGDQPKWRGFLSFNHFRVSHETSLDLPPLPFALPVSKWIETTFPAQNWAASGARLMPFIRPVRIAIDSMRPVGSVQKVASQILPNRWAQKIPEGMSWGGDIYAFEFSPQGSTTQKTGNHVYLGSFLRERDRFGREAVNPGLIDTRDGMMRIGLTDGADPSHYPIMLTKNPVWSRTGEREYTQSLAWLGQKAHDAKVAMEHVFQSLPVASHP